MKKAYFLDLLSGFVGGLLFFFVVEFLMRESILLINPVYYLALFVLFGVYYYAFLRKKIISNLFISFSVFVVGFFLPVVSWFILFRIALSNWQLF